MSFYKRRAYGVPSAIDVATHAASPRPPVNLFAPPVRDIPKQIDINARYITSPAQAPYPDAATPYPDPRAAGSMVPIVLVSPMPPPPGPMKVPRRVVKKINKAIRSVDRSNQADMAAQNAAASVTDALHYAEEAAAQASDPVTDAEARRAAKELAKRNAEATLAQAVADRAQAQAATDTAAADDAHEQAELDAARDVWLAAQMQCQEDADDRQWGRMRETWDLDREWHARSTDAASAIQQRRGNGGPFFTDPSDPFGPHDPLPGPGDFTTWNQTIPGNPGFQGYGAEAAVTLPSGTSPIVATSAGAAAGYVVGGKVGALIGAVAGFLFSRAQVPSVPVNAAPAPAAWAASIPRGNPNYDPKDPSTWVIY